MYNDCVSPGDLERASTVLSSAVNLSSCLDAAVLSIRYNCTEIYHINFRTQCLSLEARYSPRMHAQAWPCKGLPTALNRTTLSVDMVSRSGDLVERP